MEIKTEADLRAENISEKTKEYHIQPDVKLTPAAREFLMDRQITLVVDEAVEMTVTPIKATPAAKFVDAVTGEEYREKPETMTHLRGNLLVEKTHPRIIMRGKLDNLQAELLLLQTMIPEQTALCADLADAGKFTALLLQADVKDQKLTQKLRLFGLTVDELHEMSHHPKDHFGISHQIPTVQMGTTALQINRLRTIVRETELAAAAAFGKGDPLGIVEHLNRLSSGMYVLFCRVITGYYKN
ncbi:MAG: hypothetical protein E7300_02885 [Lachnospiraceae bacterium]|nr:hypothetical protein [Lachnospiraceae bacterium]